MFERLEKQVSLAVSVVAHAVLFLVLWNVYTRGIAPEPEPPAPIVMHVVSPPEQPALAAELQRQQAPPPQPQLQRTSPNPADEPSEQVPTAVEVEQEKEDQVPPASRPPREIRLRDEEAPAPLDPQTLAQWRQQVERLEAEQRKREQQVLSQISEVVGRAPGVKRPYLSAGSDRGVVREIDMARYPKHMQERFMRRYGIRIRTKLVRGGSNQSYVNAVTTDRGTYLNRGGTGFYEVMTLTQAVLARMAELEEQELRRRRLDPLRTRVLEVVFGLREDEQGRVDLVITRFRAEPIE